MFCCGIRKEKNRTNFTKDSSARISIFIASCVLARYADVCNDLFLQRLIEIPAGCMGIVMHCQEKVQMSYSMNGLEIKHDHTVFRLVMPSGELW